MQAQPELYTSIQNFLLSMIGLSVGAERVTETIKQIYSQSTKGAMSAAGVQVIAIFSGTLVTAMSTLNPLGIPHADFGWSNPRMWMNWIVTGVLVSGGSAFWNHLLDILQATKLQKEAAVSGDLPVQAPPPAPPQPAPQPA
jgi:drug/metabolite transporter (DMT)-like permease